MAKIQSFSVLFGGVFSVVFFRFVREIGGNVSRETVLEGNWGWMC
jgi:hypothetical protein